MFIIKYTQHNTLYFKTSHKSIKLDRKICCASFVKILLGKTYPFQDLRDCFKQKFLKIEIYYSLA